MNDEKPITVNLPEGQNEAVVRLGQAPKELDKLAPVKIEIYGVISAPVEFLKKRVMDIDQHLAHILVNRDNLTIQLVFNERDPYLRSSVKGAITISDIVKKLGINEGKTWQPEQLGQFFKLNRSLFVDRDENMEVVSALKSFKAKVNQDVERETKENGNRNYAFRQAVDSNIPSSFKLRIPVFKGSTPVEVEVETYACIDGPDVTIALQSAGVNDVMEDARVVAIDHEIEAIREIAPEIAIIEQ